MRYTLLILFSLSIKLSYCQTYNKVMWGVSQGASINALQVWNGKLYAGGNTFWTLAGKIVNNIAVWDGIEWDSLSSGVSGGVFALDTFNNDLIVGGSYAWVNSNPNISAISRWTGTQWLALGTNPNSGGVDNGVHSFALFNNSLFIGGYFTAIGYPYTNVQKVAEWDGNTFGAVSGGVTSCFPEARKMIKFNSKLYVGGSFCFAGGIPCNNIASWNGVQWDSLGSGVGGVVSAMAADTVNNILYVGGGFFTAGGVPVNYVAKWDGNAWAAVGTYPGIGATAMKFYQGALYVGGSSQNVSCNDPVISKWDGANWTVLTPGPNGQVLSIEEYNGCLYFGGNFTAVANDTSIKSLTCYGNNCPQNVGFKESFKELNFKVYPNPVKSLLKIELEGDRNTTYLLKLYNSTGSTIKELRFKSIIEIPVSDLPKGFYQVHICDPEGNKCSSKKVMIE